MVCANRTLFLIIAVIENFSLIHKGGNEYKGLLEINEDGERFTISVDVTFDGTTFIWEIIPY